MRRFVCVLLVVFLLLGVVVPMAAAVPGEQRITLWPELRVVDENFGAIEGAEVIIRVDGTPVQTLITGNREITAGDRIEVYGRVEIREGRTSLPPQREVVLISPRVTAQLISAPGFCLARENGEEIRFERILHWCEEDNMGSLVHFWFLEPCECAPPPVVGNFTDVRAGAWYLDSVRFVYDAGIMTGTTATTFSPAQSFSREMLTAVLFRAVHGREANASDSTHNPFNDVPATRWSAPYVTWAQSQGLVRGINAHQFQPNVPISRQDFALVLLRFAFFLDLDVQWNPNTYLAFPDANQVGEWAQFGVEWAVDSGLIRGIDGNLAPTGTADRAQAATILQRFVNTFMD